jgi:HD-GYP domain-containing protein (c-di-GMP phosphodiesterase class II)
MSVRTLDDPERLRVSFARRVAGFAGREGRTEAVVGGGFVAAAVASALWLPPGGSLSWAEAVLYVVLLAVATRVRFHFGAGFTVPTQLVLVPMLFAVPGRDVALLAAAALLLGSLPDAVRGRMRPARLGVFLGNSWFALGPGAVFALGEARSPGTGYALLVPAFLAQVLTDFIGNALREGLRGEMSARELAEDLLPVHLIDAALTPVGLAVAFAAQYRPWAPALSLPLLALLRFFSRERRARLEQLVELNDAYRGTALVLGDVIESDDAYTGEHCKSVVGLALDVARHLRLDAHRRRCTEFGALLHDVGKLAVPKEIINKPGILDEREWTIVRAHTIEGQRLLERVGGIMSEVGAIVRSSHERWDGRGYPDGLHGDAIPIESRIIAACDAYNAMTTTRAYRQAMPQEGALAELRANAGTQFDPDVVAALLRVLGT